MGDFLKKYPADQVKTDFEGKKILARKYLAKKIPTLKKIYFMASSPYKVLSPEAWGKIFLNKPNNPYPPAPTPPPQKSNSRP